MMLGVVIARGVLVGCQDVAGLFGRLLWVVAWMLLAGVEGGCLDVLGGCYDVASWLFRVF